MHLQTVRAGERHGPRQEVGGPRQEEEQSITISCRTLKCGLVRVVLHAGKEKEKMRGKYVKNGCTQEIRN